VRLELRPERRARHTRRQPRQHKLAAAGAAQPEKPVLEDQRTDRLQPPLLMDHRATHTLLATIEVTPATSAALRQMIAAAIHTLRQRHLTVLALMAGLPARFALRELLDPLTRQPPPLRPRGRRIRRRRHRTVTRTLAQTPLELLDPRLQPAHQRHDRIRALHTDRLDLIPSHTENVPRATRRSCYVNRPRERLRLRSRRSSRRSQGSAGCRASPSPGRAGG
jgi:hypothetical protein